MKLLPSLLSGLKAVCASFPDPRKGRGGNIAMADFGPFGLRNVFHAERFFPVLSTRSGERPGPIKLPEPVRHRENSVRQLHPRHARRSGPGAARALLRASGSSAGRAAFAPGLWQTGWQDARRLGWNRVLLLAKARLPALPHAPALQRQGRVVSLHAGGDGRRARPRQNRASDAGVYRAARRRRKAGLRAKRRQALVRQASRKAERLSKPRVVAAGLSRRRSLRLSAIATMVKAATSSSQPRKARTR